MSGVRAFLMRLAATLAPRRRDEDLDEEIRTHIDLQAEELVRAGMEPAEARALAMRRFGGVDRVKETCRDARGLPLVETTIRDVLYSARLLRRSPGFAVMAFLTLAIGIGATTAVFSLVNRALIQPLPVDRPGELVALNVTGARGAFPTLSYPNYVDVRDRSGVFSGLVAYRFTPISASVSGVNERLWGYLVSGNYFDVLGVRPVAGRPIGREHEARGAHPVVVVSYRFWQQRLGGSGDAIGRPVLVNGRSYTIIGVAPRGFFGTEVVAAPDMWFPIGMQAQLDNAVNLLDDRGAEIMFVVGRLAPGLSRARAAAAVEGVSARLAEEFPDVNEGKRIALTPPGLFGSAMRGPVLGFVGLLLVVAALVLILACVNLANLLLARGLDRRQEVAVRLSIGAGRGALVRQLLTESLLLSLAAGGAGLLLAAWLMRAAAAVRVPVDIPLAFDLPIDPAVMAFNVAVSAATAVMFGLLPALQATRADLVSVLKVSAASAEPASIRWRNGLIVLQVAVSLVLLTGAGLMWRALGHAATVPLGFRTAGAFEVSFDLRLQGYSPPQGREMQQRLLDTVRGLPGVESAALADLIPVDLHLTRTRVYAAGAVIERNARAPQAFLMRVTPGYFAAMGTRLEEGRDFTALDREDGQPVAIVNRALARRLWPDGSAVGRQLRIGSPEEPLLEIVGIAGDGKYASLNETGSGAVYRPLRQSYSGSTTVVARTGGDVAQAMSLVRAAVRELDPAMPIGSARTFDERLAIPLLPARVAAVALGSFGALALVLAAIGLYGVMSYAVSSRTREIGVRMALGAQRADVLRLVLGEGGRLVAIGIVAGVALALVVTRLMRAILFGVSPSDPLTYATVVAALFAVALLACWLPARRATNTDPLEALRSA